MTVTVAFAQFGIRDWHGGQTLITNAIQALHMTVPARVRVLILGGDGAESDAYRMATGADGVLRYAAEPRWSPHRLVSAAFIRWRGRNLSLEHALRRAGVQVMVSESVSWCLGEVATIGWVQDFQHRALPELFEPAERARRDQAYYETMRLADRLLAFPCVAADARQFAPELAHKIRVVRPSSIIDAELYNRNPTVVLGRFRLPEKFFYAPNQFWVHKNHLLLIEALRRLRERGVIVHVVLTGRPEDYRRTAHFDDVMRRIGAGHLEDQVHYLGVVSRGDVLDLIRQCIAVVNPSLFEGWGYAADEAAAVGKRMLISDVPAHREQAPPACVYFKPTDADDLASGLEHIWREAVAGPDAELEERARRQMPERVRNLGWTLFHVLEDIVAVRQRRNAA